MPVGLTWLPPRAEPELFGFLPPLLVPSISLYQPDLVCVPLKAQKGELSVVTDRDFSAGFQGVGASPKFSRKCGRISAGVPVGAQDGVGTASKRVRTLAAGAAGHPVHREPVREAPQSGRFNAPETALAASRTSDPASGCPFRWRRPNGPPRRSSGAIDTQTGNDYRRDVRSTGWAPQLEVLTSEITPVDPDYPGRGEPGDHPAPLLPPETTFAVWVTQIAQCPRQPRLPGLPSLLASRPSYTVDYRRYDHLHVRSPPGHLFS